MSLREFVVSLLTMMKKRRMFGIHCVRCDYEIIAPSQTELLDDKLIRHLWHCPNCKARVRILSTVSEKREASERSDDDG